MSVIFQASIRASSVSFKAAHDMISIVSPTPDLIVSDSMMRLSGSSLEKTIFLNLFMENYNLPGFRYSSPKDVHRLSFYGGSMSSALKGIKRGKPIFIGQKEGQGICVKNSLQESSSFNIIPIADPPPFAEITEHAEIPIQNPNIIVSLLSLKETFGSLAKGGKSSVRTGKIIMFEKGMSAVIAGSDKRTKAGNSWGIVLPEAAPSRTFRLEENHIKLLSKMSTILSDGQARIYYDIASEVPTSLRFEIALPIGTWVVHFIEKTTSEEMRDDDHGSRREADAKDEGVEAKGGGDRSDTEETEEESGDDH